MRICLVSALTRLNGGVKGRCADLEDAPLGPLTLAAILQAEGAEVSFIDLDSEFARQESDCSPDLFVIHTARRLAAVPANVFGFSTVCGSYPLTLRIAKELKVIRPDSVIALGGPQASVVDVSTLKNFSCIDFVVRGEADQSFPELLDALERSRVNLHFVAGLTWRSGQSIQRNPDAPPVEDLDKLPLPLYSLYREVETASCISLELGRGCPFTCTFCSTNDFFRRRFRLKSPDVVIGQMRELFTRYGVRNFSLVHDMFTVDRKRVEAFCRAMISSACGFRWSCSARTDFVDRELLKMMAEAGCDGIFYGIETGSQALQKTIQKSLDLRQSMDVVEETSRNGIASTVSTITGFPDENVQDFRDTVDFLMKAARRDDVEVQLHLLAPLAGTPIAREHAGELVLDRTQSDFSTAKLLTQQEWSWIGQLPEIFSSYYHIPSPLVNRGHLGEMARFLSIGMRSARWLLIGLHQTQGHIAGVLDAWRNSNGFRGGSDDLAAFTDFAQTHYKHPAVEAICSMQRALWQQPSGDPQASAASGNEPAISDGVKIVNLQFNLAGWLAHMRAGTLRDFRDHTSCTVAIHPGKGRERILHLHPVQSRVLALCDGSRSYREISTMVDWDFSALWPALPRETVVRVVLDTLVQEGVVSWRGRSPAAITEQVSTAA